jgi:nucleotide-binding universal stress UspA family protein
VYKHILLALDGSPLSEQALPHAEELAKGLGAKLTVLSVVEPYVIALPATPAPIPAYNIDTDLEALVADREDYLESIRDRLVADGLDADTVIRRGRPGDEIIDCARELGADVIVMTTHGRSGLSRWIYGSVAERVLHTSETPVLLIRAKAVAEEP